MDVKTIAFVRFTPTTLKKNITLMPESLGFNEIEDLLRRERKFHPVSRFISQNFVQNLRNWSMISKNIVL